jgi:hypothetical protein
LSKNFSTIALTWGQIFINCPNFTSNFKFIIIGVKAQLGGLLNYHNYNFIGLLMNLKCKIIPNIKIFNLFIIHVAIDVSENLIKNYGWVLRKKWTHCGNDDIMLITHRKWKMWTQKICHSIIKIKIKK